MPELPEVEVVRRGLAEHVVGRTFGAVEVLHPRAVRSHEGRPLPLILDATQVIDAKRRGKFLWLELGHSGTPGDNPQALVVHLRMSGQMLVTEPGALQSTHVRIRALLHGGPQADKVTELGFVDQRTFGHWEVVDMVPDPHGEYDLIPATMTHIGQDPLEHTFDVATAAARMKRKNKAIKSVLLDQDLVSGVGNIYADEALWLAGVRPSRKPARISKVGVERIIRSATEVMERALDAGGTSFDALYVNVNGASGYFSRSLNVYGRDGRPCLRCGATIKKVTLGGRGTHFCPMCQK
ncbi:bifunctional DNA-formamidopyrimidine glycosylase/DNA-(apurinic or apyrimidinic site) lyase [Corynebacterium urogenitale]